MGLVGVGEAIGQMHQEVHANPQLRIAGALGVKVGAALHLVRHRLEKFQPVAVRVTVRDSRHIGTAFQFRLQTGQVTTNPGAQQSLGLAGCDSRALVDGNHSIHLIGWRAIVSTLPFQAFSLEFCRVSTDVILEWGT